MKRESLSEGTSRVPRGKRKMEAASQERLSTACCHRTRIPFRGCCSRSRAGGATACSRGLNPFSAPIPKEGKRPRPAMQHMLGRNCAYPIPRTISFTFSNRVITDARLRRAPCRRGWKRSNHNFLRQSGSGMRYIYFFPQRMGPDRAVGSRVLPACVSLRNTLRWQSQEAARIYVAESSLSPFVLIKIPGLESLLLGALWHSREKELPVLIAGKFRRLRTP